MKILVVKSQSYESWSTPASNGKDAKGRAVDTYWLSVQFKKDDQPDEDKCWIDVKECFFSCYAHKDGTLSPKLVVMDYEYSEAPAQAKANTHRR